MTDERNGTSQRGAEQRGQAFDARMRAYLQAMHQTAVDRRGLVKIAVGGAGAAALTSLGRADSGATARFLPGLSLLRQDATSVAFGLEGDVRGLEPALAYDFTANPVVCQISEGLMLFDDQGALQPLLAESYDHPDALTYVYTLRDDIVFSDGSPVTTDDVLASIARVRDPEVAGPLAWMYDTPGATVEATGDREITITLETASALFQYVAATTAGHVIPQAAIEEFGLDLLRNPRGTGPYTLVSWDSGSQIELGKNPNYWQEGKPFFDRVIFKIVEEGTTRVTALKNNELQMMTAVPPDQIEAVQAFDNIDFQSVVGYTISCVAMRTDQPPFDDVKVRKAVVHAIDLQAIMDNLVKDSGILAHNTTVPPNMPGSASDELEPMAYDLDLAKQLLAESSQPDGFSTQLHVIAPNEVWVPQAVAIQEALKELNIEVEIDQMPYADMITLQQAGDYEGMMSFQWGSDFPDAAGNLVPLFLSTNFPPQNNHAFYFNPEVDRLLNESEAELDPETRDQMLREAQKLISDDQPWIFLEHYRWYMPMNKELTGYTVTPLWYWDAWSRDLKPAST